MPSVKGMIKRTEGLFAKLLTKLLYVDRKRVERKIIKKNLKTIGTIGYSLTGEEKEKIGALWGRYGTSFCFWEFYTAATDVFDERYVPDDLYYTTIDAFYNDRIGYRYIDNKCYYDMYFPNQLQPQVLGKRINWYWIDMEGGISTLDKIYDICQNEECVFVKPAVNSAGGHGIKRIDMNRASKEDFALCMRAYKNDIVIQRKIIQNEVISRIYPNSVNTIRIITWMDPKGKVSVLSKVLRLGVGDSYVDNASSGGVVVGIDDYNCLKKNAYSESGEKFDRHPSTGVEFNGIHLPGVDKASELTKVLHVKFPHYRLISWDLSIDQCENPILVEFNIHHGELGFHQLCNGPLFGDRTMEMVEEVYGKRCTREVTS